MGQRHERSRGEGARGRGPERRKPERAARTRPGERPQEPPYHDRDESTYRLPAPAPGGGGPSYAEDRWRDYSGARAPGYAGVARRERHEPARRGAAASIPGRWAGYGAGWTQGGQAPGARPPEPGPYVGRGPKGYRRSDDRIKEDVCDRLTESGELDASDIEVTVVGGEVTLEGEAQDRHAKLIAEELADGVAGVVDIHNRIRVRREPGR